MATRNRTQLSGEFLNPPPFKTSAFEKPIAEQINGEFLKGFQPMRGDRFNPAASQNVRPASAGLAGVLKSSGARITQIFLGRRDIDFKEDGPLLRLNENDQWVVPTPVRSLPPRNLLEDQRGRILEYTERLSDRQLKALQNRFRVKTVLPKLEQYAAALHACYYVLQPLTQILVRTLDADSHLYFINFSVNQRTNQWPALLYEARSGSLFVYGGENFTFG